MKRGIVWAAVCAAAGMATASAGSAAAIAAGAGGAALLWFALTRRNVRQTAAMTILFAASAGWYELTDARNVTGLPADVEEGTEAVVEGIVAAPPEIDGDRAVFDIARASIDIAGRSELQVNERERIKVYVRFAAPDELEEAEAWRRGDRATVKGSLRKPLAATNFDGFDYRGYVRRQYVHWTLNVKGGDSAELERGERWTIHRLLGAVDSVRNTLARKLSDIYPEPYAGLMQGLVIGLRDGLDPEVYRQFSQIGLSHILAISGLHVGLFVGAVLWVLGKLPLTRERRFSTAIVLVPLYVVLTGASPSVLRAGAMAVIALLLARKGRLRDGLHVLAFVAIAMLAWRPYYLYDVSFQLSFAVTAGLIIGVPQVSRLLPVRNRALNSAAAVTITAQLVSFPLTIYYFNGFSLLSFPANFVLVPVFSLLVLPLGTISLLLSFAIPVGAEAAAWIAVQLSETSIQAMEALNRVDSEKPLK